MPTASATVEPLSDTLLEIPDGVTCARGVCVLSDDDEPSVIITDPILEMAAAAAATAAAAEDLVVETRAEGVREMNAGFIWPRALLLFSSVLYGSNFPLGRLMNDALPASASTSARFVLAFGALIPFLPKLSPALRTRALICGCFTALGYVGQSIALVDTPAATVSFLGCLTVVTCPVLSVLIDKKALAFKDAPQVWVAAGLALVGVGALELGPLLTSSAAAETSGSYAGDVWSVLQAIGFGTSFFLTGLMMAKEPGQALPITAVQCGTTAAIAATWATCDGLGLLGGGGGAGGGADGAWLLNEATRTSFAFPGLVREGLAGVTSLAGGGGSAGAGAGAGSGLQAVAAAAAWTGLITTAGNRLAETTALGKVSSSEASVLLATEPLWAVVFASLLISEMPGYWDAFGGALLVLACLANSAEEPLRALLSMEIESDEDEELSAAAAAAAADCD